MRVLLAALLVVVPLQLAVDAAQQPTVPVEDTSGLSPEARRERLKEFHQKQREFNKKWKALDQERKAERKQLRDQKLALMNTEQRARAEARRAEWQSLSPEQRKARRAERVALMKAKRQKKHNASKAPSNEKIVEPSTP